MARVKCIGIRETLTSSLPEAEFERPAHEGGAVGRRRKELSKPGVPGATTENVEWVDLDFSPIREASDKAVICDRVPSIGGHHRGAQSRSHTFAQSRPFAKTVPTGGVKESRAPPSTAPWYAATASPARTPRCAASSQASRPLTHKSPPYWSSTPARRRRSTSARVPKSSTCVPVSC